MIKSLEILNLISKLELNESNKQEQTEEFVDKLQSSFVEQRAKENPKTK